MVGFASPRGDGFSGSGSAAGPKKSGSHQLRRFRLSGHSVFGVVESYGSEIGIAAFPAAPGRHARLIGIEIGFTIKRAARDRILAPSSGPPA
jgi:hypothetical protein